VIPWRDVDDLRSLANDIQYGLAAGIWSGDVAKALKLADLIDAGTVWINTYGMFDVAVPFGGRKHSGYGRELGDEALEPYLQSKSVWLDLESSVPQSGQGISR
jgi:acyl-CoA reductase-like NAD-dependent aldehyde dehydrogenase